MGDPVWGQASGFSDERLAFESFDILLPLTSHSFGPFLDAHAPSNTPVQGSHD